MNDEWKDLLASWEVPDPEPELRKKVLDIYREQFHGSRSSILKRLVTVRIPIPFPVAAVTMLLLLATSYFALRSGQPASLTQAGLVSATNQKKGLVNPSAQDSEVARASLPDLHNRSKATTSASTGIPSKAAGSQPPKIGQKRSTITLQGGQETIQCLAGTDYQPIAVPRIYAGMVFNPSEAR